LRQTFALEWSQSGTVFLLWFSRVNYILRRVRGGEGGRRRGALQESTARLINAVLYHFVK
jgi:hypothetical protein